MTLPNRRLRRRAMTIGLSITFTKQAIATLPRQGTTVEPSAWEWCASEMLIVVL